MENPKPAQSLEELENRIQSLESSQELNEKHLSKIERERLDFLEKEIENIKLDFLIKKTDS